MIAMKGQRAMTIHLGKTEASMLNPPNEGTVIDGDKEWQIGRNREGMIMLRKYSGLSLIPECHPDFVEGMTMQSFCMWINERL